MRPRISIALLTVVSFFGCGDDGSPIADSGRDAAAEVDAGADVSAVDAASPDVDDPSPSIDFRVNAMSGSVEVGPGEASVTWQAREVSGCAASADPAVDGWAGELELSGERTLVITQNTVLTLACDALTERVNVAFSLMCDESVHPPGLRMAEGTYAEFNDGFGFGESTNASFLLDIPTNSFFALSGFSLPTENVRRRIVFVDAPTNRTQMDGGTVSVSECPGDFSESATCVFSVNNMSTLFFSTRPSEELDVYCVLDPTKTYFINYVTSQDPYSVPPTCRADGTRCAMFYSESLVGG